MEQELQECGDVHAGILHGGAEPNKPYEIYVQAGKCACVYVCIYVCACVCMNTVLHT